MECKIDIKKIMKMIPHRFPFVLVDRILELVIGETCVGLKNVTINEPFFAGHFPEDPIMPGVLIIEAMAQTAAVAVCMTFDDPYAEKSVYFMSIENAKFRKPVTPGDQLIINIKKLKQKAAIWKFQAHVEVDGKVVAEAKLTAMVRKGEALND